MDPSFSSGAASSSPSEDDEWGLFLSSSALSLCLSFSVFTSPSFPFLRPDEFWLIYVLCVWPEERDFFYAGGRGRRSGTIRGFNLGICCLLLL
jgi:hypothetical protein